MSVYLCIPSARPDGGTISAWAAAGYKTAIWRDPGASPIDANITIVGRYPGYSKASNALIKLALADPACQWVVGGGDDVLPDPNHTPEEIAEECYAWFPYSNGGTFGVMQPTGDPWRDLQGRIIERIAGSPWIGRTFAERVYGGNGPWWPEFDHMFSDEHLLNVATKLGVYWMRPDLTHFHNHPLRNGDRSKLPDFLEQWNTTQHWNKSKAIFDRLKAGGFAEAECISR